MEYLTDIQKAKLENFVKDPVMFEAVKSVLLAGIYQNGTLRKGVKADPLKNFALSLAFNPQFSNEQLGADLRACAEGINLVENGFNELIKIAEAKGGKPSPLKGKNPAI